jgi:conjugal transfer pilus assembly protein TraD
VRTRRGSPYLLLIAFAALLVVPAWVATVAAGLAVAVTGVRAARFIAGRRGRQTGKPADAIMIGSDASGRETWITERELASHGLILGASGAGKTTTLLTILTQLIERGRPVVAIDMKGSPSFARALEQAAAAAGRPFRIWTPDGPNHWNPLQYGNATELKDKLIGSERFTEPHYQRAAERYVLNVLQVLEHIHPERPPTLDEVVQLMDPRRLGALLRGLERPLSERVQDYLASLTYDQVSGIRGLQTRLAIVTESHTGRYLQPSIGVRDAAEPGAGAGAAEPGAGAGAAGPGAARGAAHREAAPGAAHDVDIRRALAGPEVVLFSLNSNTYGQLAAQLGTLAVQDVICASGYRLRERALGGQQDLAIVAIDESSVLGDQLVTLFARGREAGVAALSVTQEMVDYDRIARGLRDQVLGNTEIKLAHRQEVPKSAETIAEIAGTEKVWEETERIGGSLLGGYPGARGTRREVERFVVHPNEIKTLAPGDAVLISKARGGRARVVRVRPPERPKPDLSL